jgi:hypothetical protein
MPASPWLTARSDALRRHPALAAVLDAFGGGHHPDGPRPTDGAERIREALADEVDPDQASLFARRFEVARQLLGELPGERGALLLDGLCYRLAEILDGPGPHALRVRALVDFYASQVPRMLHPAGPTVEDHARSARWNDTVGGLQAALLECPSEAGPLRVSLLRGRPRLRCLDARPRTDLLALAHEEGAVAAVSGGFFLYSEPDIAPPSRRTDPVGLLVTDGEVVQPPFFARGALLQGARTEVRVVHPAEALLDGRPLGPLTRAHAERGPSEVSTALVGTTAIATGRRLPVPLNGAVVRGLHPEPSWELPGVHSAMGGGPMLVVDGQIAIDPASEDFRGSAPPITFSRDETFDHNLLPRLAAGLLPDGRLVLAAVDGRQLQTATGLTLRQTARLLRALGCVQAVNLDGGSSKRMVLDGRLLDRPTTELVVRGWPTSEPRPVHSAVLLYPEAP